MIFYFSGTGNSEYVAKRLSEATGETTIFMSEQTIQELSRNDGAIDITVESTERIGFVFPVYYYGIPSIVKKFLSRLSIQGYHDQYAYVIATYGGAAGEAGRVTERMLSDRGIHLNATFGVTMIDNYILGYDLPSPKKQEEIQSQAKVAITTIVNQVVDREHVRTMKLGWYAFAAPMIHQLYEHSSRSKKFYSTDACIGCGLCEKNCPCQVITVKDKKVVWNASFECTQCLRCIHQCPVRAIEYGRFTKKRQRLNPTK